MNKAQLQKTANELISQLNQKYPVVLNDMNDPIIRVVEYKGVKYELDYDWDSNYISSIYKDGDVYSKVIRRGVGQEYCRLDWQQVSDCTSGD